MYCLLRLRCAAISAGLALTVSCNQCLAFDEDGFRTGMTVEEVGQRLAPKQRLEIFVSQFELYVAVPQAKGKPISDPAFQFCHGALVTYSYRITWKTYTRLLDHYLVEWGHPKKIFLTPDAIGPSLEEPAIQMEWALGDDSVALSYSPTAGDHSNDATRKYPAEIWFIAPNPCDGLGRDRTRALPRIG